MLWIRNEKNSDGSSMHQIEFYQLNPDPNDEERISYRLVISSGPDIEQEYRDLFSTYLGEIALILASVYSILPNGTVLKLIDHYAESTIDVEIAIRILESASNFRPNLSLINHR